MSEAPAVLTAAARRSFYLRKMHSLSGIVPVGGFMFFHLFENHKATISPQAYDDMVSTINHMPFILMLEIFGIWLPLLFHALYGFVIVLEGKPNPLSHPYARNWLYSLQRWTGVLAFVFIVFHFVNFRMIPREDFLPEFGNSPFDIVRQQFEQAAWVLPAYVIGLVACVFHFSNGVWGFLCSWGILIGPKAQRVAAWVCAAAGTGILALGLDSIYAFVAKGA
jgi:succinate dehydrogenase/fumarate reductase cytochrome b subunit (b558 family)